MNETKTSDPRVRVLASTANSGITAGPQQPSSTFPAPTGPAPDASPCRSLTGADVSELRAEQKFARLRQKYGEGWRVFGPKFSLNLKGKKTRLINAILATAKKDIVYGDRVELPKRRGLRTEGRRVHPGLPVPSQSQKDACRS